MDKKTKYKLNIGIGFVIALIYLLLPTDFVPDPMPVAGWIDDIIAILLAIANAVRMGAKLRNANNNGKELAQKPDQPKQ